MCNLFFTQGTPNHIYVKNKAHKNILTAKNLVKSYTPSKSVINYWRQSFGQGWRRKHEKSCFFVRKWSYLFVRLIIFDAVFWKWSFELWANFWYDFWGIKNIFTQESGPVKWCQLLRYPCFDVKIRRIAILNRPWFLCKYIFHTSKIISKIRP